MDVLLLPKLNTFMEKENICPGIVCLRYREKKVTQQSNKDFNMFLELISQDIRTMLPYK